MRRTLATVAGIVVLAAGGLTVAAARDGAGASPEAGASQPRPAWTGPAPITPAQKAFRKAYLAAILAGDPGVVECGCTGGIRARERAARIAAQKAARKTASRP